MMTMMEEMKRISQLIFSFGGIIFLLLNVQPVYAQCFGGGFGQFNNLCNVNLANGSIIATIVTFLLVLSVILALFFIIRGAIRWISSGGDRGKVDQARSTITTAIIGLVVALVVYFIVNFILYFFTGGSLQGMTVPRLVP